MYFTERDTKARRKTRDVVACLSKVCGARVSNFHLGVPSELRGCSSDDHELNFKSGGRKKVSKVGWRKGGISAVTAFVAVKLSGRGRRRRQSLSGGVVYPYYTRAWVKLNSLRRRFSLLYFSRLETTTTTTTTTTRGLNAILCTRLRVHVSVYVVCPSAPVLPSLPLGSVARPDQNLEGEFSHQEREGGLN